MGEMTIRDIAKRCGVGIGTVSRAINNHPDINPDTKRMVMDVIRETGFVPNNSARNLKRTDARCIAVLVKGITNPFFSSAVKVIEKEVQKKKYTMVMQHVESYENELEAALELVKEKRLRGIIFLGGSYHHDKEQLSMLKVPFVFCTIGTAEETEENRAYSNIAVDDRKESMKIVDHLLKMGHRRIAIITEGAKGESVGQLRLQGYRDAHEARGITVDETLVYEVREKDDPYTMKNGYRMAKEIMRSKTRFTAVFAIADHLAVGVCRALYEAGLKVPEDVSVAGFDGLAIGEYYTPQLTTISQPVERMAKETVQLLLNVISGKAAHQQIIFPGELILRESTAKPPDGDVVFEGGHQEKKVDPMNGLPLKY